MVIGNISEKREVVVVGGGPGGYVAAIRAADLGKEVALIERRPRLGGTCLLEGCIPSKALIAGVETVESIKRAGKMGISVDGLKVDHRKLRKHAESVVDTLSKGIDGLLKRRDIEVIQADARFRNSNELMLEGADFSSMQFEQCILASGSRVIELPMTKGLDVWSSTEALELRSIPKRMLVIGGGYIGLELGLVYAGLGSRVTCVELLPQLLTGADPDLTKVVHKRCEQRFEEILLETKVVDVKKKGGGFSVTVEQQGSKKKLDFDQVLVAVGRKPNTENIGLENTKVQLDQRGLVEVDEQNRTADPSIFAIGDITSGPALAHKASREGKVAAEVIAGKSSAFDNVAIPAIVFTDPEVAWVGLTESEARATDRNIEVGKFPLAALGRARTIDQTDGLAKVIADADSGLVLGVGLVGPHASELIAEAALALEMGATLEDITATIHPHPTLSEAIAEAAEVAEGLPVHIFIPRRKK